MKYQALCSCVAGSTLLFSQVGTMHAFEKVQGVSSRKHKKTDAEFTVPYCFKSVDGYIGGGSSFSGCIIPSEQSAMCSVVEKGVSGRALKCEMKSQKVGAGSVLKRWLKSSISFAAGVFGGIFNVLEKTIDLKMLWRCIKVVGKGFITFFDSDTESKNNQSTLDLLRFLESLNFSLFDAEKSKKALEKLLKLVKVNLGVYHFDSLETFSQMDVDSQVNILESPFFVCPMKKSDTTLVIRSSINRERFIEIKKESFVDFATSVISGSSFGDCYHKDGTWKTDVLERLKLGFSRICTGALFVPAFGYFLLPSRELRSYCRQASFVAWLALGCLYYFPCAAVKGSREAFQDLRGLLLW